MNQSWRSRLPSYTQEIVDFSIKYQKEMHHLQLPGDVLYITIAEVVKWAEFEMQQLAQAGGVALPDPDEDRFKFNFPPKE